MKLGRVVLAIIFFVIFIAAALTAIDALGSLTYEDLFPENVNAVIWIHKPNDVPLRVLNSSIARNFFKTPQGKELQKQLDDTLAQLGAASADKKAAPKPVIFSKTVEGVKVYYPEIIKPVATETAEAAPEAPVEETAAATPESESAGEATPEAKPAPVAPKPEAKPAAKKKGMVLNRAKIEQALGLGGAVVQDLYIALYGDPMAGMQSAMENKPKFMFAMDLGRLSMFSRMILPSAAKPLPAARKPGEDEKLPIAFAFARNMVIAGDPEAIEQMIHAWKGTPMTVTKVIEIPASETEEASPSTPEEAVAPPEKKVQTQTLNLVSLAKSKGKLWKRVKRSFRKDATFTLALLVPNLLDKLKADESMKEQIAQVNEKYGLSRILALVHSNQMDKPGLSIQTEIIFDPPSPILSLLNQQARELSFPKLLPASYIFGAGLTIDNLPGLWKSAETLLGDSLDGTKKQVMDKFGADDFDAFLGIMSNEISIIQVETEGGTATVHCDSVNATAKDFLSKLEEKTAEAAMAEAEKAIETATGAGAETYAAEAMSKAKEALEAAKAAVGEKKNVETVVLARKTKQFADAALLTLTKEAKAILNSASSEFASVVGEEMEAADNVLREATDAYEQGSPAAGTEAAKKALNIAKVAFSLGKASKAIANAKDAGAETKAKETYVAAQTALTAAKDAYKQGNYTVAISQAETALAQAQQAIKASGGEPYEEPAVGTPEAMDFSLPQVQSPRVSENIEVLRSVGVESVDYALLPNNNLCYGATEDMDAFLKAPKGEAIKSPNMMELMGAMPHETQALAVINVLGYLKSSGTTPPEDMAEFIKTINPLVGGYVLVKEDNVVMAVISPIKLFDGSTSSGARSALVALFFLSKWLFYILGIVFAYLGVRMLMKKEPK